TRQATRMRRPPRRSRPRRAPRRPPAPLPRGRPEGVRAARPGGRAWPEASSWSWWRPAGSGFGQEGNDEPYTGTAVPMTRRLHPAAWMLWATCAGLVVFSTRNPFYLGPVVAAAWFVYAACHVQGPSARAFLTFALGGLIAMMLRTALVFLGTVDASSVVYAALEGA